MDFLVLIVVLIFLYLIGWLFPFLIVISSIFAIIAVIVAVRNFWIATEEPSNDGRPPKD